MPAAEPAPAREPGARSDFEDAVAEVIRALSPGELLTYGEVAAEAGHPGAARAVGRFLRDHGDGVSWWRVVPASGRLAPHLAVEQSARLVAEGVEVRDGRIVAPAPPPSGR